MKTSDLGAYSIAGGGVGTTDCTITLTGINSLTVHSKKDMINIKIGQSGTTQSSSPSDKFNVKVIDLKRGTDEIKIRGFVEDTAANDTSVDVDGSPEAGATSAWEKVWILRAMCANGGALTELVIDNLTFSTSTQEAHLEEVTIIANPDDSGALNTSQGDSRARIELELNILLGVDRYNE